MKHALLALFIISTALVNAQNPGVNHRAFVDAGVTEIISPVYHNINFNHQFIVVVKNFGTLPVQGFYMIYTHGNNQSSYFCQDTIAPSESDTVMLSILSLNAGTQEICAYTNIPADTVTSNNGVCKDVHVRLTRQPPYFDDFELHEYFMKDTSKLQSTQWVRTQPQGAAINNALSGQKCWVTSASAITAFSGTDMLYPPPVVRYLNGIDSLVFWHYLHTGANDLAYIEYLDSNNTWKILGELNDTSAVNWYNTGSSARPGFNGNSGGWVRAAILVNQPKFADMGLFTRFRFVYYSDGTNSSTDGWALDDFYVKKPRSSKDAGVVEILNPADTCIAGTVQQITVSIKNYGTDTLTSIPLSYKINNNSVVSDNWTGSLLPDSSVIFTFNQSYTPAHMDFSVSAYTQLAADGLLLNDTSFKQVTVQKAGQDAGVVGFGDPAFYSPGYNDSIFMQISLFNFGSDTLKQIPLNLKMGHLPEVSLMWTGVLAPADSVVYTTPTKVAIPIGMVQICAYTTLANDSVFDNDTYCGMYLNSAIPEKSGLPGFELHHAAPNPAQNSTSINFSVPYPGVIKLIAFDLHGRQLHSEEARCTQGDNQLPLNVSGWSNGIYILMLEFEGHRVLTKLVKTK